MLDSSRRVKICQRFCDELYKHCKSAEFNGNTIDTLYKTGVQFCEANNFQVVSNDCFAFDEGVFSAASLLLPVNVFLVIFVRVCQINLQ